MQYTGLKDRNGRDIYEGDILDGYSVVSFGEYDNGLDFEDNVSGYGWYRSFPKEKDSWIEAMGVSHTRSYEVIGNIYENPELLK